MGMMNLEEIQVWCDANGAVLDVELPKPTKKPTVQVVDAGVIRPLEEILKDPPKFEAPPFEVKEEQKIEKKQKVSKKEENDPSSGSE